MKNEQGDYGIYDSFQVIQTSDYIFKGKEDIFK